MRKINPIPYDWENLRWGIRRKVIEHDGLFYVEEIVKGKSYKVHPYHGFSTKEEAWEFAKSLSHQ